MSEMGGKMYQIRRSEIFKAKKGLKLFSHRFEQVMFLEIILSASIYSNKSKWSIIKHEKDNKKK